MTSHRLHRDQVKRLRKAHRCPDCASDVRVRAGDGPVIARIEVHHDTTCPTWRSRGSRPYTLIKVTPNGDSTL